MRPQGNIFVNFVQNSSPVCNSFEGVANKYFFSFFAETRLPPTFTSILHLKYILLLIDM